MGAATYFISRSRSCYTEAPARRHSDSIITLQWGCFLDAERRIIGVALRVLAESGGTHGERDQAWLLHKVSYLFVPNYSDNFRSLRAFAITETELKVIAALAIMGLSSKPKKG